MYNNKQTKQRKEEKKMETNQIDYGIQEWANAHVPGENMIYKDAYWDQILFVRDRIPSIFAKDFGEFENIQKNINVVSTHTSKSITLPVYNVYLKDLGVTLIMRNNFYDWKISVVSEKELAIDFMELFDEKQKITEMYCEGFKSQWVYPSYEENKQNFTIELSNDYELFTFLWTLKSQLKKSE